MNWADFMGHFSSLGEVEDADTILRNSSVKPTGGGAADYGETDYY